MMMVMILLVIDSDEQYDDAGVDGYVDDTYDADVGYDDAAIVVDCADDGTGYDY